MAIDLALDCKESPEELWNRISKDEYMGYAVQECYYSAERILHSLVDDKEIHDATGKLDSSAKLDAAGRIWYVLSKMIPVAFLIYFYKYLTFPSLYCLVQG